MKITKLFLCLIMTSVIISCDNTKEIPVIYLDQNLDKIDLKLSDLLEEISVIHVEDRDDILISPNNQIFITDKKLYIYNNKDIFEFDKTGKYIRTILRNGRGPGEILDLRSFMCDEKRGFFYYLELSKEGIQCLDLNTLNHLDPIGNNTTNLLKIIDEKGNIYGRIGAFWTILGDKMEMPDSVILGFKYDYDEGKVSEYIAPVPFISGLDPALSRFGNDLCIISFGNDTIYKMKGEKLIPISTLSVSDKLVNWEDGGIYLYLNMAYSGGMIISREYSKLEHRSKPLIQKDYFNIYVDKNNKAHIIANFYIDPLDKSVDMYDVYERRNENKPLDFNPILNISDEYAYYSFDPIRFIDYAKSALESDKLDNKFRDYYSYLIDNLNEDSNPVIILGKIK